MSSWAKRDGLIFDICFPKAIISPGCSPPPTDVEAIANDPNALKRRLQYQAKNSEFQVRTYQGHGVNSGVSIRVDHPNNFLSKPGLLVHGTSLGVMAPILRSGLKLMERNAIHMIPLEQSVNQPEYIARAKTTRLIVIDANAAILQGKQSFFESADNVILCDGNESGAIPPEFVVAIFSQYSTRRPPCAFETRP